MKRPFEPNGLKVGGKTAARDGAILGLVMVALLIMSIIGASLLRVTETDAVETANQVNITKAFWSAEAGLHNTRAMLRSSAPYRASPGTLTESAELNYSAIAVSNYATIYTITSTGTAPNVSRTLAQTVDVYVGWPPAFDYLLFGGGGDTWIRRESVINGDIFQNGEIRFDGTQVITGDVVATEGVSGYPASELPDPVPTMPPLDTSYYDGLIATAKSSGGGSPTYPLSLNGSTVYVKGSGKGKSEEIETISGSGILVIGGDAEFKKELSVGSDLMIVSGGTFTIDKNFSAQSNCILYASTGFKIAMNTDISLGNCTLITPGDIYVNMDFTMSGILYAGGTITTKQNFTLEGSALAGGGFTIFKSPDLTYDSSQFPSFIPPGFTPEVTLTNIFWEEQF